MLAAWLALTVHPPVSPGTMLGRRTLLDALRRAPPWAGQANIEASRPRLCRRIKFHASKAAAVIQVGVPQFMAATVPCLPAQCKRT